jgi:hypothetical protein
MVDMKKKAKTREYTKVASDVEEPCGFVFQPPKSEARDGRRRLILAILFCVFFIICEITGEIYHCIITTKVVYMGFHLVGYFS